jgi:peptidoglycan/xylan/chitin deacetylase (PgdA/CDA1 family)
MGIRLRLARALDSTGALDLVLRARRLAGPPWLTVLTWHRVGDPASARAVDDGTIDATPEEFDWQCAMIKRHFNVVRLADVYGFLDGKRLPRNPALLTFDDGYLDCWTTARPILERHGLTAVFFIATRYMEERRLFWWDRVARAVKSATVPRAVLSYPEHMELDLANASGAMARLLTLIKTRRGLDVWRLLEELEHAVGAPLPREDERKLVDELLMSWDQVRELRARGMDVGSHTRTHRVLGTVAGDGELDGELAGSRHDLEARLGEEVRAIAYPVGPSVMHLPQVVAAMHRAGYRLGFTNKSGINRASLGHPFDIRRLATDRGVEPAYFRASLALPRFG